MDDYRIEVCLSLRQLERLDKTTFTDNDRADAEEVGIIYEHLIYAGLCVLVS